MAVLPPPMTTTAPAERPRGAAVHVAQEVEAGRTPASVSPGDAAPASSAARRRPRKIGVEDDSGRAAGRAPTRAPVRMSTPSLRAAGRSRRRGSRAAAGTRGCRSAASRRPRLRVEHRHRVMAARARGGTRSSRPAGPEPTMADARARRARDAVHDLARRRRSRAPRPRSRARSRGPRPRRRGRAGCRRASHG